MTKSFLLTALLGLASLSHALPSGYNILSQMEEMRLAVEEYNRNLPEEEYQAMSRTILEPSKENAPCDKAFLIFARGTFEAAGTNYLGSMVGMPYLTALKQAIPGIGGAGVNYSNDVFGYLTGYIGGTTPGAAIMAKALQEKAAQCPQTKIIASGYSQGAQVTHQAIKAVNEEVRRHIALVVVFGDPMKGTAIPGIAKEKVYTNCASDDPICGGLPIPLGSHLTYNAKDSIAKTVDWTKKNLVL